MIVHEICLLPAAAADPGEAELDPKLGGETGEIRAQKMDRVAEALMRRALPRMCPDETEVVTVGQAALGKVIVIEI